MDHTGFDISTTGSVISRERLEEQRRKRGECLTCGRKCYNIKFFKKVPITDHGNVLEGRCLHCHPLQARRRSTVLLAVSRPATQKDLDNFALSQTSLKQADASFRSTASSSSTRNSIRARALSASSESFGPEEGSLRAVSENEPAGLPGIGRPRAGSAQPAKSYRTPPTVNRRSSRSVKSAPAAGITEIAEAAEQVSRSTPEAADGVARAAAESHEGLGDMVYRATMGGMAAKRLAENYREHHPDADRESLSARTPASLKTTGEDDHGIPLTSVDMSAPAVDHHDDMGISSLSLDCHDAFTSNTSVESPRSGEYPSPSHGMLNRGGAVRLNSKGELTLKKEAMNAESARTLSSMSSGGSTGASASDLVHPISPEQVQPSSSNQMKGSSSKSIDSARSMGSSHSTRNEVLNEADQQALSTLRQAGSDYTIIVEIMQNSGSARIQQEAMNSLTQISFTDADLTALVSLGVIEAILASMLDHKQSADVQSAGCGAIWNLSATTETQLLLVQAGALDTIVSVMNEFPKDSAVLEKALAALSNLAAAEVNQEALHKKKVLAKVADAMNNHTEDRNVQMKGCTVITNVASYNTPAKAQIMETGAGGLIVVSMSMHLKDVELQERALRALRNICANSEENKVAIANVGGIDATISAMQVHRNEDGVQLAGAWTLSNLSANAENREIIGDSGGIDVIIRAMWVHPGNTQIQEWCCRALSLLTIDVHNRDIVLQVGGINAIVNAMQDHTHSAVVQEKGCSTMSNLACGNDDIKMQIVDEEALDAISLAMVLHSDNANVQDKACSVLRRLAIPSNTKQLQAANVVELVRTARNKFPDKCGQKADEIMAAL